MPPVIKVKRRTSGKDGSRNRYNTFFNGNNCWKELAPLILVGNYWLEIPLLLRISNDLSPQVQLKYVLDKIFCLSNQGWKL